MPNENASPCAPAKQIAAQPQTTTFSAILRRRAAECPHKRAFVFLDAHGGVAEETTYAALDYRARAIASELVANGLHGQRVLLVFPPGLDFIAALFGCFYAGAVAVPIPFLSGKRIVERLTSIMRDADPAGILTVGRLKEQQQLRVALSGLAHKFVWILVDNIDQEFRCASLPNPNSNELAILQYTSGSTGSPKGVMLSHANLIANNAMIANAFGHDASLRGVGWLPLFHDMGLVGHVLQPVYVGGLSVLMSPLVFLQRPARWLQTISAWRATTSGGPSFAFELCLTAIRDEQIESLDLSSWRVAYCGSEKVRADVLDRFSNRFARCGFRRASLLPCFGLAEATLLVTGARSETGISTASHAGSFISSGLVVDCGPRACGSSVIAVDPDTEAKLDDGCVGEIWVQGPHVGQGYWRADNSVDNPFRANLIDGSGPYLRTGDLGFIRDNRLFVTGRIKDTIIVNGLKHSAEDIEATAAQSHQLFAGFSGAAFGIDVGGQERAVLVQEIARARVEPDKLAEAVARTFASVSRDHGLRLFDLVAVRTGSLPRTSSGKIRRSRARDTYLARGFERLNPRGTLFALDNKPGLTSREPALNDVPR